LLLSRSITYGLTSFFAGATMPEPCSSSAFPSLPLAPLAPHWSDYIWQEVLKNPSTVTLTRFPVPGTPNLTLTSASVYVRATTSAIGAAEGSQQKKLAKGKAAAFDPKRDKQLTVFVATRWPAWQAKYVALVRERFARLGVVDAKEMAGQMQKSEMKKAMPFVQSLKRRLEGGEGSEEVLERKLPFGEVMVLSEMVPGLKSTFMKLVRVRLVEVEEGAKEGVDVLSGEKVAPLPPVAGSAEPGNPSFEFQNV